MLGLGVNIVGLVFFHEHAHGHSHGEGGGCSHAHHAKEKATQVLERINDSPKTNSGKVKKEEESEI